MFQRTWAVAAAVLFLAGPYAAAQTTWYVDDSAPGPGNGTAASPFLQIQTAINAAQGGDTVLVFPGTYAELINYMGKALTVKSVAGPSLTVIDGGQGGSVVTFATGEGPNATLQGFTITNGLGAAGAAGPPSGNGGPGHAGGIHCQGSAPTITRCVLTNNTGGSGGAGGAGQPSGGSGGRGGAGGIGVPGSMALVTGCLFSGNNGGSGGAGGSGTGGSATAGPGGRGGPGGLGVDAGGVTGCSFTGNTGGAGGPGGSSLGTGATGGTGGAGGCEVRNATITGCTLLTGTGGPGGPGGFMGAGGPGGAGGVLAVAATVTNCFLVQNTGGSGGTPGTGYIGTVPGGPGGLEARGSLVTNCSLTGNAPPANSSSVIPGGIFATHIGFINPTSITNTIVWQNTGPEISTVPTSPPTVFVNYCDVQGGFTGTANINTDPNFVDVTNADLHLLPSSPCIDAGDNTAPAIPATDIDGDPRVFHGTADIGADETILTLLITQSGGPGSPVSVQNHNLTTGGEYFNVFSLEPCPGGVGTGPYLGLCAMNPVNAQFILDQIMLPTGSAPFHFIANASSVMWGPFSVPPLTLDAVCFEFTGGALGPVSNVTRVTIQ